MINPLYELDWECEPSLDVFGEYHISALYHRQEAAFDNSNVTPKPDGVIDLEQSRQEEYIVSNMIEQIPNMLATLNEAKDIINSFNYGGVSSETVEDIDRIFNIAHYEINEEVTS